MSRAARRSTRLSACALVRFSVCLAAVGSLLVLLLEAFLLLLLLEMFVGTVVGVWVFECVSYDIIVLLCVASCRQENAVHFFLLRRTAGCLDFSSAFVLVVKTPYIVLPLYRFVSNSYHSVLVLIDEKTHSILFPLDRLCVVRSLLTRTRLPPFLTRTVSFAFLLLFLSFYSQRAVQVAFELGRERNPSVIAHERRSKLSKTRVDVSEKMAEYNHWASEADKHIDHKACCR